jgi:hypothetical protein
MIVTKKEITNFLLIAVLVTMLLFLPIILDVFADSFSNTITTQIIETKKLISTEEAIKPTQPSTSSSETVQTSPNGGKNFFANIDESLAVIPGTVSGTATLQLTTKLLNLLALNEIIIQMHDYLEGAYGLTVVFLTSIVARIKIRKDVRFPIMHAVEII